jgi:hypothetical protein
MARTGVNVLTLNVESPHLQGMHFPVDLDRLTIISCFTNIV